MIDSKYHLVSLAAVFLALGIGILLGLALGGGPTGHTQAITRQSQAIQRLNEQFKNYSEKLSQKQAAIDSLTDDIKAADALAGAWAPGLVKGSLTSKGVALVQIGDGEDISASVRKFLTSAGASVNSLTRIESGFGFDSQDEMAAAAKQVPLEFQEPGKEAYQQVWAFVASVLASGRANKPFQSLQAAGLLQVREGSYDKPNRFVVVLGPGTPAEGALIDLVLRPMTEKMRAAKLGVVLATPAPPAGEMAPDTWRQMDIPTVTHASMTFGQICLVDALMKGEGHYGLGTSEEFLPRRMLSK